MVCGESSGFAILMSDRLAMETGANIRGSFLNVNINADGNKKSISGPGAGNYFSVGKTFKDIETIFGGDVLRERSAFLAHGTGTPLNRITESHIMSTFAKEFGIENLPVSSVKSKLGHTMGAAGVGAQALKVFDPEKEMLIAVMLTLAILYFSEIIPKTMGAMYWRVLGVPAAHMIIWLGRLAYPLVWISTRLTKLLGNKKMGAVTREEILALASLGQRHGALISQETLYLQNILRMRRVRTGEILTPRSVVHMLDESLTISSALSNEKTRLFSRIPVYAGTVDTVTGHVLRSDLYEAERAGRGLETIESLRRDVISVSKKLPIHKLINLFIWPLYPKNRIQEN